MPLPPKVNYWFFLTLFLALPKFSLRKHQNKHRQILAKMFVFLII